MAHLNYDNPLITRYASRQMAELWGPQRKFSMWRRLWLALAEAQHELGMPSADSKTPRIKPEQLAELRQHLDDIDFDRAAEHEKRLRHDVMAHIHTLGEVAPGCKDIIHLGATSCFVTDNTDLILIHEALGLIRGQLVGVIDGLARFAQQFRDLPTLGYTHFQPAQLTTVGKRACLWCFDFVLDLEEIERRIAGLPFRGVKGTTGTQASFLALFQGDHAKVRELDRRVAAKMGFADVLPVTGQTYSRKLDSQVMDLLSGIAQSASKCATDLRLLAHEQEIDEPSEAEQVGSSAMAYKKNPMRSERVCSISRFVTGLAPMAAETAATQWLERTLDDSAARRLYLPQAFLGVDAVLRLMLNVVGGLKVNRAIVEQHVAEQLPFMATENLLMTGVAKGGDRQALHERIRIHSNDVASDRKSGVASASLQQRLANDPAFAGVDVADELDARRFVGRAPEQVDEFIATVVEPIRARYPQHVNQSATTHV
ncbi:MAG: adenylosuccinate lyase [Gemmataceae bacterium]